MNRQSSRPTDLCRDETTNQSRANAAYACNGAERPYKMTNDVRWV